MNSTERILQYKSLKLVIYKGNFNFDINFARVKFYFTMLRSIKI